MLEDADEINEVMGRAYGVPEELDENDLMDGQPTHADEETGAIDAPLHGQLDVHRWPCLLPAAV